MKKKSLLTSKFIQPLNESPGSLRVIIIALRAIRYGMV